MDEFELEAAEVLLSLNPRGTKRKRVDLLELDGEVFAVSPSLKCYRCGRVLGFPADAKIGRALALCKCGARVLYRFGITMKFVGEGAEVGLIPRAQRKIRGA